MEPRENDKTASTFRVSEDVLLMLPSLRGANENPGKMECFLGEVDDIVAAAKYLRSRPDVDPDRIYLGGHSTGATLAVLAAETTDLFRAVFALGPVSDPRIYGESPCVPSDAGRKEYILRAPGEWLSDIRSPTFVIEGEQGNAVELPNFRTFRGRVTTVEVPGADHFSVIVPASEVILREIIEDTGTEPSLEVTASKIAARISG